MRQPKPLSLIAFLLILWMTAGCATTNLPSITASGNGFTPLPGEEELWEESRHEERTLRRHVTLYEDADFEAHTQAIVDRLSPTGNFSDPGPDYRVFLIENDALNAFSYPHGSIYIHTGLLSTIDGEDQLATIIAHEMQHIERRHSLRKVRQERNQRRRWTALGVGSIAALIALDIDAIDDGDWARHDFLTIFADDLIEVGLIGFALAAEASVEGYGEELEFEADDGAFRRLASTGYDVDEGVRVFDLLIDGTADGHGSQNFFYSNPGALEERRQRVQEQWSVALLDTQSEQLAGSSTP